MGLVIWRQKGDQSLCQFSGAPFLNLSKTSTSPRKQTCKQKSGTCHTTFFFWLKWHSVIASDDNDDDVLDDSGDSDNDNFDEDDIAIVIDLSTSFWAYVFFKIWFSEPSWAC